MKEPNTDLDSTSHEELETQLRKMRGRRFFLFPLLWIPAAWLAAALGSSIALGIHHGIFPDGNAEPFITVGGGAMAVSAPFLAGFFMGRSFWKIKAALADDIGEPPPPKWKYPLLFGLAQLGLTTLYVALLALAAAAILFGGCLLIMRGNKF